MLLSLRLRWNTRSAKPTLTMVRRFGLVMSNSRVLPQRNVPSCSLRLMASVRSDRLSM